AILPSVASNLPCRMRRRQETQAAVRAQTVEHRNPDRRGRKRFDRRVGGIAVPWRGGTPQRAFVEDAGSPKDDVGTDDLLDDVHDVGMCGYIQPARRRFQTFEAASRNMRTYHVVIRQSRIVLYQLQCQRLQLGDVLLRQPVRWNYETVAVISLNLLGTED